MDLEARIAEPEAACTAIVDRLIAGNAQMLEESQAFREETRTSLSAVRAHARLD